MPDHTIPLPALAALRLADLDAAAKQAAALRDAFLSGLLYGAGVDVDRVTTYRLTDAGLTLTLTDSHDAP